jgi:hypothetical protein
MFFGWGFILLNQLPREKCWLGVWVGIASCIDLVLLFAIIRLQNLAICAIRSIY